MTILLVSNVAILFCVAYLVYRDAKRYDRASRSLDTEDGSSLSKFVPIALQRRFNDYRPVERATTSRLSITKGLIATEEAEGRKVKVI